MWLAAALAPAQNPTPAADVPTFGTTVVIPSGFRGEIYRIHHRTRCLPDFRSLEPIGAIYANALNVPTRWFKEGFPGVTRRFEWFAIDYTGRFWIDTPGTYRFALMSDDGSKLYIDGRVVIDNDCQHPPEKKESEIALTGGIHRIRVSYFQGPRFQVALVLSVAGEGERWRIFNLQEFKPPANPDDWKYGDANQLKPAPDPDAGRTRLRDKSKKRARKSTEP